MKKFVLVLLTVIICFGFAFGSENSETSENSVSSERPTVAVVLSGGGAKGIVHVALLEELERLGIPVDIVIGTSMGSVIGGFYCAGYSPADIKEVISNTDLSSLFSSIGEDYTDTIEPFEYSTLNLLSIGVNSSGVGNMSGIISDSDILELFRTNLSRIPDEISFDELTIPYRCIATNAITGDEKVFDSGSLVDSIRASMGIPLVFEPYEVEDELYFDGGLVDNMGAKIAYDMGYDIIICEDVNNTNNPTVESYFSLTSTADALLRLVVDRNVKPQYQYATIVLTPDVKDVGVLDFSDPEKAIEIGHIEMENRHEELMEIASLFTEDQKEYKDPERKGAYFSLPEVKTSDSETETTNTVNRAFDMTRLSMGFSITGDLSFLNRDPKEVIFESTMSTKVRLYVKGLIGNKLDGTIQLKVGKQSELSFEGLGFLTNRDEGISVIAVPYVAVSGGSLSVITDRANKSSSYINGMEMGYEAAIKLKITNESDNGYGLDVGIKGLWYYDNPYEPSKTTNWFPCASLYGIGVSDFGDVLYSNESKRYDFLFNAGLFNGQLTYKMNVAAQYGFPVGNGFDLSYDVFALTSREPKILMDSYSSFGGLRGVPGVPAELYVRDMVMLGVTASKDLSDQELLVNSIGLVIRAGIRSKETAFLSENQTAKTDFTETNIMPFSELSMDQLEVGVAVYYGIVTPIGSLKIGIGVSSKLNAALYFSLT